METAPDQDPVRRSVRAQRVEQRGVLGHEVLPALHDRR